MNRMEAELWELVGRNGQKGDGSAMDFGLAVARAAYRLGVRRGRKLENELARALQRRRARAEFGGTAVRKVIPRNTRAGSDPIRVTADPGTAAPPVREHFAPDGTINTASPMGGQLDKA